jgi:hypothetical protein
MTATPAVYVYRPGDDGPSKIGWARAYVNSYGMPLIPSRLVKADYVEPEDPNERRTASDKPDHILEADKPFRCAPGGELETFVKSCQLFRRLSSTEYQVTGSGEVLLADNLGRRRFPPRKNNMRQSTKTRSKPCSAPRPMPVGAPSRKRRQRN